MCFSPSTFGAGGKTRLESRIKIFLNHIPFMIYFPGLELRIRVVALLFPTPTMYASLFRYFPPPPPPFWGVGGFLAPGVKKKMPQS